MYDEPFDADDDDDGLRYWTVDPDLAEEPDEDAVELPVRFPMLMPPRKFPLVVDLPTEDEPAVAVLVVSVLVRCPAPMFVVNRSEVM